MLGWAGNKMGLIIVTHGDFEIARQVVNGRHRAVLDICLLGKRMNDS